MPARDKIEASHMWKPVIGFEGLYEVSDEGQARRLAGFWCRSNRLLTPDVGRNGYWRIRLCDRTSRQGRKFLLHRVVYRHFVGEIADGLTVNHKDGDKSNNRASNLELATMSDQMHHAYGTGLQARAKGEARTNVAKLTDAAVLEIRRAYVPRRVTYRALARRFGVSVSCISTVVNRTRWTHI